MTVHPPISFSTARSTARHVPPRVVDPGRRRRVRWRVVAVLALAVAGCSDPPPSPPAPIAAPTREDASAGLLVAASGPIQVSDGSGGLRLVDPRSDAAVRVSAGDGVIVATKPDGTVAVLDGAAAAHWRALDLDPVPDGAIRFVAASPSGDSLAVATGDPTALTFQLAIVNVAGGGARRSVIKRGLNGGPVWLGPDTIAIDVTAADQMTGFVTIAAASGALTEHPGPWTTLAAAAGGTRLAVDSSDDGALLIGDVAGWLAGETSTFGRVTGPPGASIDQLAVDGPGQRVAVVWRTDAGATIEVLVRRGPAWTSVLAITEPADPRVSIAWLG